MKNIPLALCACLLAAVAFPAYAGKAKPMVLASMTVRGTVSVSATGYVTSFKLYEPGRLPKVVVNLLKRTIPYWRFHPVTFKGKPVAVKARMYARIVAKPLGNHRDSISIVSLSIATKDKNSDNFVTYAKGFRHAPPEYPPRALRLSVIGNVYLLLQINREGKVLHVAAKEVDLMTAGDPAAMNQWRHMLAHAAVHAARNWRFQVSSNSTSSDNYFWYATIPVAFRIGVGLRRDGKYIKWGDYGRWEIYIPGPVQFIPWVPRQKMANANTAQPVGTVQLLSQGLRRIDRHGG